MIVIGELHARLLRKFATLVELLGGLLPDVGRLAEIFGNPGADNVFQSNRLRRFDNGGEFIVEFVVLYVGGDRVETILVRK